MRLGKYQITAERWPWQPGYSWRGMDNCSAPLNRGGARFGGGWKYQLGISIGGSSCVINLLFGMISIRPIRKPRA